MAVFSHTRVLNALLFVLVSAYEVTFFARAFADSVGGAFHAAPDASRAARSGAGGHSAGGVAESGAGLGGAEPAFAVAARAEDGGGGGDHGDDCGAGRKIAAGLGAEESRGVEKGGRGGFAGGHRQALGGIFHPAGTPPGAGRAGFRLLPNHPALGGDVRDGRGGRR